MDIAFWEREMGLTNCDVLIVGAGIVGLSAGIALQKSSPDLRITVIDRSPFSDGGSTRNAGFACFGSPRELLDDCDANGEFEMLENVRRRWKGLQLLLGELGSENIGYQATGSLEIAHRGSWGDCPDTLSEEIDWLNAKLGAITGMKSTFVSAPSHILTGLNLDSMSSIWYSPLEGMLHSGQMMLALERRAAVAGIVVRRGLNVESIERNANGTATLRLRAAFNDQPETFSVCPPRTLLAINGLTAQFLEDAEVERVPNQVLVTSRLSDGLPKCPIHAESGFVYARPLPSGQMLIGGGRHWLGIGPEEREARLVEWLRRAVPSTMHTEVEMRWTGYLGVGPSKHTRVESLTPCLFGAWRLGGMGVATGMAIGQELARLSSE
ncbi:MAG: NAD(P)/FAD-dependent oxidoreductase [Flavobacteriales bacterium]